MERNTEGKLTEIIALLSNHLFTLGKQYGILTPPLVNKLREALRMPECLDNIPFCQVLGYKEAITDAFDRQTRFLLLSNFKPESLFSVMPSGDIITDADLDMFLCTEMFEEDFDYTVMDQSSVGGSTIMSHKTKAIFKPASFSKLTAKPRMEKMKTHNPEMLTECLEEPELAGSQRFIIYGQDFKFDAPSIPQTPERSVEFQNELQSDIMYFNKQKANIPSKFLSSKVMANRMTKPYPVIEINAAAEQESFDSEQLGKSPSRGTSMSNEPSMMRGDDLSVNVSIDKLQKSSKLDEDTPKFSPKKDNYWIDQNQEQIKESNNKFSYKDDKKYSRPLIKLFQTALSDDEK